MNASPPAIRRLCLAVDVESYSTRPRAEQIDVQNRLLWTMVQACRTARINPARCDRQDSGDGQILILPTGIDEGKVLPDAILGLLTALYRVNNPIGPGGRIRLRVSVGQGAIQVGSVGFVAPAVVTVCRLLDSDELRKALTGSPRQDAAFIVMTDLYHDMFAHGYGGLPAGRFRRVFVRKRAKKFAEEAWIQVPDGLPAVAAVPTYSEPAELHHRQISGGVLVELGAAATVAWAVFAGLRSGHGDPGPGNDHGHPADHHDTSGHGDAHGHPDDHSLSDHAPGDHGPGDHGTLDHSLGDHGTADHGHGDHGTADHGLGGHDDLTSDHPGGHDADVGSPDYGSDYGAAEPGSHASDDSYYDTADHYATDHGMTGDHSVGDAHHGVF